MGGTTAGDIGVMPTAFVVISRPVPWTKKRDVRKKIRAVLHSSGYFEDDGPADVRIFVRWRSDPELSPVSLDGAPRAAVRPRADEKW